MSGSGAGLTAGWAVVLGDIAWTGGRFEASTAFPGLPQHAGTARGFVSRVLGERHPCAEQAVLLVSELVTNSVVHSGSAGPGGAIGVTVSGTLISVTVEVADAGSETVPQVRPDGDLDDESGRGLRLVAAIADEWGHRQNTAGQVTWFTVTAS